VSRFPRACITRGIRPAAHLASWAALCPGNNERAGKLAHTLLRIVYHVLADGTMYRELGGDYHNRRHQQRLTRRAIHLLQRQGLPRNP
jgi:hypothetical protein